jgi:sugar phosphate isomerase/epimerase
VTDDQTLGRNDLLASFYTLSGSPNGEPSRFSFDERVAAAAKAGFAAVGLTLFDVAACTSDGRTEADLAAIAADHGIRVDEIETLSLTLTPTDEEREQARAVFALGERIRAHHANVLFRLPPGTPVDRDLAAEAFARTCDLAAEHGLVVAFEFMPFMAVGTVEVASDIVGRAGRANGGLVVDSYHFYRGGSSLADLAAVPAERFVTLQLSDVPATPPAGELIVETRTQRRLPGEGELPLEEFIRTIDAAGSNASIGVEILSDPLRALPVEDAATSVAEATRALLARARS